MQFKSRTCKWNTKNSEANLPLDSNCVHVSQCKHCQYLKNFQKGADGDMLQKSITQHSDIAKLSVNKRKKEHFLYFKSDLLSDFVC